MTRADSITSLQNPQLKRLVRLHARRGREHEGVMLIEGARELARALAAGVRPTEVYSCPELFSPDAAGLVSQWPLTPTELSRAAFEKVSGRENPDGVLAVAARPCVQLPELPDDAVVVVLDGLEKPGNVGAILRTADAAGAAAVLVLGRGADPYGPNVIRASQGSVFALPVAALDEQAAHAYLTAQGCVTVACTPDAPRVYWDAPLTGRVALLLGTEHAGLPSHWRQAGAQGSGLSASIPMQPGSKADSLNVATAAALMLFECARQRRTSAELAPPEVGA